MVFLFLPVAIHMIHIIQIVPGTDTDAVTALTYGIKLKVTLDYIVNNVMISGIGAGIAHWLERRTRD